MKITVQTLIELNKQKHSNDIDKKLPLVTARRLCNADEVAKAKAGILTC